jgi:hypothetical protein
MLRYDEYPDDTPRQVIRLKVAAGCAAQVAETAQARVAEMKSK